MPQNKTSHLNIPLNLPLGCSVQNTPNCSLEGTLDSCIQEPFLHTRVEILRCRTKKRDSAHSTGQTLIQCSSYLKKKGGSLHHSCEGMEWASHGEK